MPELAEVLYFSKQWKRGGPHLIKQVHCLAEKRVFRGTDTKLIQKNLPGLKLNATRTHGKQMVFGFEKKFWLFVHLGMAGKLFQSPLPYSPEKHDHLVLYTPKRALIYRDTRHFGRIQIAEGKDPPDWDRLPPELLADEFNAVYLKAFLERRKKSPIKAVILMQEAFPGIGNWMADEILWRAAIHPAEPAGNLTPAQRGRLLREIRTVANGAIETIGVDWSDPPDSWLFKHRWKDGGICPKTGKNLVREQIGGRTTCYSPSRQIINAVS